MELRASFTTNLQPQTPTLYAVVVELTSLIHLSYCLLFIEIQLFCLLSILTTRRNIVLILALRVEEWRVEVQGHSWLYSNFKTSLSYMRPWLKTTTTMTKHTHTPPTATTRILITISNILEPITKPIFFGILFKRLSRVNCTHHLLCVIH